MDIRIKAIHFDVAEKLTSFINKKVERLPVTTKIYLRLT